MNATEIEEIKKTLIKEIKNTEKKIIEYSELCKPIPPENSIGRVSRMDAINNKSVLESVLRKTEKKLKELLHAKKQSEENIDFGKCIICNNEINIKRLFIMPYVKKCISCAKRIL